LAKRQRPGLRIEPFGQRLENVAAKPTREAGIKLEDLVTHVPRVAAEELVAAVACEHVIDAVALGEQRAAKSRYGRGVAERLVVRRRDFRHELDDVARHDLVRVVTATEALARYSRVAELVEIR